MPSKNHAINDLYNSSSQYLIESSMYVCEFQTEVIVSLGPISNDWGLTEAGDQIRGEKQEVAGRSDRIRTSDLQFLEMLGSGFG